MFAARKRGDDFLGIGNIAFRANTVTTTGPACRLSPSLPSTVSAACSRDTPMENPVAGTGSPRKRDTSPS